MGSDKWSDTNSTFVPSSGQSIADEVDAVACVTEKERSKDSITISIVHKQNLAMLNRKCKYIRKFFAREEPPTHFTTAEGLQDTINAIKLSAKYGTLNLLVSPRIAELFFHVPSHFRRLKVLRCAKHRERGELLIDGTSTYHNVRLDEWQANKHKNHHFSINHERGTRIKLNDIVNLPGWGQCRSKFSESEEEELRQHFEELSGKSHWDEAKGTVAAIVGLAAGAVKFCVGLSGAAGGVYVKYTFGLQAFELGAAGTTGNVVATAAGPAIVLGVTAAAAVYFIPWVSLFNWLERALVSLWDKAFALWQRFKDWVMSLLAKNSGWPRCLGPSKDSG